MMRIRQSLAAVSLLAVVMAETFAQTPARDAAQPIPVPSGAGAISGIVRDELARPVRRAAVTISGDMRLERLTITDEDGRFAFDGLPAGRFTVTAAKPGYPRMSYGAKRPFRAGSGLWLKDGQTVRDIALTLARGGVFTGTVYDERGAPMPGVPVMAWEVRTSLAGERTLEMPATGGESVTSDDRGTYRIFGLPPGEYTIGTSWSYHGASDVRVPTDAEIRAAFQSAQQPAGTGRSSPMPAAGAALAQYNYSPVFAPGVVEPLSAQTWTLAPGEERAGADLRMQFRQMGRIEATVLMPDGAPAAARLMVSRNNLVRSLNTSQVAFTGADGRYSSTSLSPDRYTVTAQVAARADVPALWARTEVSLAGGQTLPVTLTLQPAPAITGRVVFQGTIAPPADLTRVLVRVGSVGFSPPDITASTDASGAVLMTGVIPGRYSVVGSVPNTARPGEPAWTVRSVVVGGRDVADRPLEVGSGGVSDLVVTFTDQVSELSGTITTEAGLPATDYFIVAIPADREYWLPLSRRIVSTRPGAEGQYLFRGLPAGDYRIALTTDLVPTDLRDPAALERLAAQSAPVAVAIGERRTLNLRAAGSR